MTHSLKIYRQHPEAFTIELNTHEHCILQPITGKYYQINSTGLVIWNMLRKLNSIDEVNRQVNRNSKNIAEQDISMFISDLCKNYLLIEEEISLEDFDLYRILIGLG